MSIAVQLPPPQNWQDFEVLCQKLMEDEWGAPARLHGRTGQSQRGVDVYAGKDGGFLVAQCKLKNHWQGGRVTEKELAHEVGLAKGFDDNVVCFTMLTTAERDVKLQAAARELSKTAGFAVDVLFWDDLAERLQQRPELLRQGYGWCLPDEARDREIKGYLQSLRERLGALPIAAIADANRSAPTLESVYTAVDVLESVGRDARMTIPGEPAHSATPGEAPYLDALRTALRPPETDGEPDETQTGISRRLRAVEFLAGHRYAVMLGPPGSGKSAFGCFVAICLANQRLLGAERGVGQLAPALEGEPWTSQETWPHGALLPLFVELRAFVADAANFPAENALVGAGHLLDHLASKHARGRVPDAMLPILRSELLAGGKGRGVQLILDGLDETPNAEAVRDRLRQVILAFKTEYPHARILVTSRPYAYRDNSPWRLPPEFAVETLAPLSEPAVERFVRAWYGELGRRQVAGSRQLDDRADRLLARLRRDRDLQPFGERPLMLTLLTSLHASGRMGDGGKAAILAESVQLLFDRWNEVVHHAGTEHFTEQFRMRRDDVLDVLARVAYRVHLEQGGGTAGAAPIEFELIWEEFGKARSEAVGTDERAMLDYLDKRAGILLAEGKKTFRFPHRSFQEFLAARFLKADDEYPDQLVARVREDPVLWREVLGHVVLMHAYEGNPHSVWSLLDELFDGDEAVDAETAVRLAIAMGTAITESAKLRDKARRATLGLAKKIERLRELLLACIEGGMLSAGDRVEAGDALGRLDDPRIGHRPENFIPFRDAAGEGMGRYLVTVHEYAEFVEAGGYGKERWWEPDGGLALRDERGWREPQDWALQLEYPNRPIVGVSWFEAAAYCRWRTADSGASVRLPTSDEWTAAARSPTGNWPWGEPDVTPELANYGSEIGHPSPVGCYPDGAGPQGHLDLAGSAYESLATGRSGSSTGPVRLLRGGSWLSAGGLSLAFHHVAGNDAGGRRVDVGFRVVAPASR